MNGKQIIAVLKKEGWTLARVEGSHYIMEKEGMIRGVPIPVHGRINDPLGNSSS